MKKIKYYNGDKPISKEFDSRFQARIRYRCKKNNCNVQEAIEQDNGETNKIFFKGELLSEIVSRESYLRIYNRVRYDKTEDDFDLKVQKAIEKEIAKHPECLNEKN